ncbi:uncharacterized protein SAPINGB_P000485 [Magnusiomyces paraingens]|uniref:Uncharacterized protein n=1 Tax=Magnusiomyces paraingens TaxID=2606893 RepID=A0A5E8B128_9ASCO|nr:uncharacterized protein SAPINGB_P000485 [Saprochaete ingens]VVT44645.1 unnamed protein product [Saprochaete ingens]
MSRLFFPPANVLRSVYRPVCFPLFSARHASKLAPVLTANAPQPVGPYSQAISARGVLYLSGQIPLTSSGIPVQSADIRDHTRQVLDNLSSVLQAGGSSLERVVKVNVFVTDIKQFGAVNEVYAEYFKTNTPARSLVEVSALPLGVPLEIEAVALVEEK